MLIFAIPPRRGASASHSIYIVSALTHCMRSRSVWVAASRARIYLLSCGPTTKYYILHFTLLI
jgi:hypothetical protein